MRTGYRAKVILQSAGWLLGGTRCHESIVFADMRDAESWAQQSKEVNINRPGYQDAQIAVVIETKKNWLR